MCRLAYARLKKMTFWAARSIHPKWRYRLQDAKEAFRLAMKESEEKDIESFFKNLQHYPAGERVNRTFRYLKKYKKKVQPKLSGCTIRLDDWIPAAEDIVLIPDPLPELLGSTIPPPPSLTEIEQIISGLKNGKSPGVDSVHNEYFKYCNEATTKELHQLLAKVWEENKMPEEWKHVLVVPIPKVKNPKTINEYRRICLSSAAYKVYATWILSKLQQAVGPIGFHQAAFLPERSTVDHLHTLQRILQERWNGGVPLLLMSLDIEKAFDRVSLSSLPAILRGKRVPACFINRILECLRGEQQQVMWRGQLSRPIQRTRGLNRVVPYPLLYLTL
ncbi:uncharacterized protein LOC110680944 [Aedes aegypti]|uniref:Reverse transcriptase domain-containing protein n=1 Tax=Aedes aegypti TaxID=7159 RepID=A0A903VHN7_AEDAE|nr:uncharacterized protein LOC110680944 [Aedes aegypti]